MDTWLKAEFEKEFGSVVSRTVGNISHIKGDTMMALSTSIVGHLWESEQMSEFRSSVSEMVTRKSSVGNGPLGSIAPTRESRVENDAIGSCDHANSRTSLTVVLPSSDTSFGPNENCDRMYLGHKLSETCKSSMVQVPLNNERMQALELLVRAPVSDLVFSPTWPHLQQELCEGLSDENSVVFGLVLRIHARLLSSSSINSINEGFLSILEGLTIYYLSNRTSQLLPTFFSGIQLDNNVHKQIISIAKCALETICEFPRKWVRFGEKRVQEIIENFIDLLSMHTHQHRTVITAETHETTLYPFHVISVLDPKARWCHSVKHASFGRTIFMKTIAKSPNLLQFLLEEILKGLEQYIQYANDLPLVSSSTNISEGMVKLSVLMHSLSLVKILINGDRGCFIFPIQTNLEQDPVTAYSLTIKLLIFLNRQRVQSIQAYSKHVVELLEDIAASLILCRGARILSVRSTHLARLLTECPEGSSSKLILYKHNINILYKLSQSEHGISWMLGRPEKRNRDVHCRTVSDVQTPSSASRKESFASIQSPSPALTVADCALSVLKDKDHLTQCQDICHIAGLLLSLCGKLFGTTDGFLVLKNHRNQLVPVAGNLYIYLSNDYTTGIGKHPDSHLSIHLYLEKFLIVIAMTPLGFTAVSNVDGLVGHLIASYINQPMATWDDPQFLCFMEMTVLLSDSNLKMLRKALLTIFLRDLWSSLGDAYAFMTMEKQNQQGAINLFLSRVLSVCASPDVILELLIDSAASEDMSDVSSEKTLVDDFLEPPDPLSLSTLLRSGIEHAQPLHVHYVCLCTLYTLTYDIDVSAILQETLNLQEHLQQLQTESSVCLRDQSSVYAAELLSSPRRETNIQDECSILREHVLGVLRRVRDRGTFDVLSLPSSWNIVSPRSQTRTARTARLRTQTDLQRFLQDTRLGLHDSMWLNYARRAYRLSCQNELKMCVLIDLLEQILRCQSFPTPSPCWPSGVVEHSRSDYYKHAIHLVIRYGCHQRVLNWSLAAHHTEQLGLLLDQAQMFLSPTKGVSSFDWFVASVFLMCSGNSERSRCLLQRVAMLHLGPLIWPSLCDAPWQSSATFHHQLQSMVTEFVPQANGFLLADGVPWWHVMMRLTQQAFLPAIPLSQLPHVIALCALHSFDYALYFRTAILAHLQPRFLNCATLGPARSLLSEHPIDSFCVGEYIPFMDKLAKFSRYHVGREKSFMSTL